MLQPSTVNSTWARLLVHLFSTTAAISSTTFLPSRLISFLHIIAYAVWLGSNVWHTIFAALTMFKNLPRQTFGMLQSKLFPKYFALTTCCNAVLLGSILIPALHAKPSALTDVQQLPAPVLHTAIVLGVALLCSAANMFYVGPVSTELMLERYAIDNKEQKTEEDSKKVQSLYKQFSKYHGVSSLLNLVITGVAFYHGWFLASALSLQIV
ncbi:hypothetical protein DUNSADRAFT_4496 [Dunaliella salina]|uniref:TMEM205-like domain-containing protein n=1 Tax=Dunaliella salina TaxID=3046 RepID=A0ABQ7GRV7_DUNSA|nr:hypothetical protein DUNSADRAFT_4496 [Dunaliella salina]|eukprot:KAF5837337.1 hypothetical protein DUNSADRAFT_4496 [Dunaliella salina]